MRIEVADIGLLHRADLLVDGLTVITGLNDSGKSTVGRILYSIYHGEVYWKKRIVADTIEFILEPLRKIPDFNRMNLVDMQLRTFLQNNLAKFSERAFMQEFQKIVEESLKQYYPQAQKQIVQEVVRAAQQSTQSDFRTTVRSNAKKKIFQNEFNSKIHNVYSKNVSGFVKLTQGEDAFLVQVNQDDIKFTGEMPASLYYDDATYIDTPLNLSDATEIFPPLMMSFLYDNHNKDIYEKLLQPTEKKANIVGQVNLERQTAAIRKKINAILKGKINYDGAHLVYQKNDGQSFGISTIANGLKSYGVLAKLLDNGYLTKEMMLIVDEPEVHLHPEWQLDFVELLVMLVKTLDMTIVLTTHSPYVLQALDLYKEKYGLTERTHFYMAKREAEGSVMECVDDDLSKAYDLLAKPLERLQEVYEAVKNDNR